MSRALVDTDLKEMIKKEVLYSDFNLNEFVQPASIDIPLGNRAYLVKEKILPFNKRIVDIMDEITIDEIPLKDGALFLKGQTYLVPCLSINLPQKYYARISPKSSIGRIDVLVRAIFDNSGLYDSIAEGSEGSLWLEITPQSFNLRVREGQVLNQIRVFEKEEGDRLHSLPEERLLFDKHGNAVKRTTHDESLIMTLSIEPKSLVGYEALPSNEVLDLSKLKSHEPLKFFKPIHSGADRKITLEKDKFYIVATKEKIAIPTSHCAEMVPFSHLVGELRAHYAGFFDPGFGYGAQGEHKGATAVLEIRPHETITIYDGQPICLMDFFRNTKVPETSYGEKGNNYQLQEGPKLSKFFK